MNAADEPRAQRFDDPGWTIDDLTAEDVLVACPSCGGCARVLVTARTPQPVMWWPRRLVCAHCTRTEERPPGSPVWNWREGRDPYFSAPLWLQEPCCGHVLWALNETHLHLLRDHVGARLRQRPPESGAATSVLERLPAWMTSARHRAEVLRAVERLHQRIPQ